MTIEPLHSNMVIFKCICSLCFLLTDFFTFQYGYIQIRESRIGNSRKSRLYIPIWLYSNSISQDTQEIRKETLHSNMVIFKFEYSATVSYKPCRLYIPIWLYSNEQGTARIAGLLAGFTFQYGYIQILFN